MVVKIGHIGDIVNDTLAHIDPSRRNAQLEKELLESLLLDVFRFDLDAKVEQPEITFHGKVLIGNDNKIIEELIKRRSMQLHADLLLDAAQRVKSYIMANSQELSFTSAFMDDRRGSRKKIYSYHEPENHSFDVKQLVHKYRGPFINFLIGGFAPASITTLLSYLPQVSSNWLVNVPQQGIFWGAFAAGATVVAVYYGAKFARDPRKEYVRIRDILGREVIIQDEIRLSPDAHYVRPTQGLYTGKQVTYLLTPKHNTKNIPTKNQTINLVNWLEKNPMKPLFKVAISDNATPYTIWYTTLDLRVNDERAILEIYRSFEYKRRKIRLSELVPSESRDWYITAEKFGAIQTYTQARLINA